MRTIALLLTLISLLCPISMATAASEGASSAITIEGVTRATHLSSSGVNLYVLLRNNSHHTLVLKRGEVDIMVDGNLRSTISLRERVTIPKGHHGEVLLPLRFRSVNSLALQSILRRVAEGDSDDITISYNMRGGTRLMKRSLRGEDIAISEFLDTFAIPQSVIAHVEELIK